MALADRTAAQFETELKAEHTEKRKQDKFSLDIKSVDIQDVSSEGAWLACKGCSGCFD